ncbi:MAG TPA: hypothetical protein VL588_03895, partial [Bdellovibrionota bacterium]|nr:hypothetical protein [Bdellovibrionota bacterium]
MRSFALAMVLLSAPCLAAQAPVECHPQEAQEFLLRSTTIHNPEALKRSIAYRRQEYGSPVSTDAGSAASQAVDTLFMGLPVKLHRRIVDAVACAEKKIRSECAEPYHAGHLSGLRLKNTYTGGEVSNHLFGLALD